MLFYIRQNIKIRPITLYRGDTLGCTVEMLLHERTQRTRVLYLSRLIPPGILLVLVVQYSTSRCHRQLACYVVLVPGTMRGQQKFICTTTQMYVSYSSFHAILIPMNHVKKMISEIDSRCKPKISVFGGVYLDFVLRCCPLFLLESHIWPLCLSLHYGMKKLQLRCETQETDNLFNKFLEYIFCFIIMRMFCIETNARRRGKKIIFIFWDNRYASVKKIFYTFQYQIFKPLLKKTG